MAAGNLTIAGVRHMRFNAVAIIEFTIGDGGGNVDHQLAVGIELAFLLADLIAAVIGITVVAGFRIAGLDLFIVGVVQQRRPVPASINPIFHLGSRDGLTEIILGVDGRLNLFAFQHAGYRGSAQDAAASSLLA